MTVGELIDRLTVLDRELPVLVHIGRPVEYEVRGVHVAPAVNIERGVDDHGMYGSQELPLRCVVEI